jgi:glutamate racemase
MNDLPIGVFDSGVGGLTVALEIVRQLPDEQLVYFGDTARFPYGPRPQDEVRSFVLEILDFLSRQPVKLIVIACNTGAAAGLKAAQGRFEIPIIGVVEPGARGAVETSRSRHIGVIGTEGTVSSGAYVAAIHALDAGIEVTQQACPPFADLVERGRVDGPEVENIAREYLAPVKAAGVDALIMGCTHYPLLAPVLARVMGPDVALISSADETAREVREILGRRGHLRPTDGPPLRRVFATGDVGQFLDLGARIFGDEIEEVEEVSLDGTGAATLTGEVARL